MAKSFDKTSTTGLKRQLGLQLLRQNESKMNGCTFKIVCRKNRINKHGLAPLIIRFFIGGKKGEIALNIFIPHKLWNDKRQQIDDKGNNLYENYNLLIERERSNFNDALVHIKLQNLEPTFELVKAMLDNKGSREDFLIFFEQTFLDRWNKNQIEETTYRVQKAVLNKCKIFKSSWPFAEITKEFLKDFDTWHLKHLQETVETRGKQLKNNGYNTIQKGQAVIKTYLNLAKLAKINFDMPIISVSYISTTRDFCTEVELKSIIKKYKAGDFSKNHELEKVVEMFLFSCSTGLRISDLHFITQSKISDGFLIFKPYKSRKRYKEIHIPISPFIEKLLLKKGDHIFGNFTEQVVNRKLKDVADICGIDKNLSMHVGRHTFATMFLQKGGDIKALQDILGHSDIKTTMNYLHKDIDHLKRQMEKSVNSIFGK